MKLITYLGTVLALIWCMSSSVFAQNQDKTVMKIGNESISLEEFKYIYQKNNANTPDAWTEASLKSYAELFAKFKMKVLEARNLKIDTLPAFVEEFTAYKEQLTQPYLTEKSITDQLIKEAYNRLKEEINASHILVMVDAYASPEDTLKAYNKIKEAHKKALAGENFENLAVHYSEDPSVQTNNGNLGYFTALQMVYPFENAAFNTPVGKISNIIRTRFGYHILNVHNRRASNGSVLMAHIMVRATEGMPAEDSVAAHQKIMEIEKKVKAGEDWEALCRQFSDDTRTKNSGGVLPWFTSGNMLPAFEEALFELKSPNEISKIVKSPYGWHLIKLLEKKPLESFEELAPILKEKVSRDSRAEVQQEFFIKRIKKENGFEENKANQKLIFTKVDTSLTAGNWTFDHKDKNIEKELFRIGKKPYKLHDFYEFVERNQNKVENIKPESYMSLLYEDFVVYSLRQDEAERLPQKFPDFRYLVNEYYDGILLFKIMEDKVWTKALTDQKGLESFFEANKEKYRWTERAKVQIFNCADKATLEAVKKDLAVGKYKVDKEALHTKLTFTAGIDTLNEQQALALDPLMTELNRRKDYFVEMEYSLNKKDKENILKKRLANITEYILIDTIDRNRISAKPTGKAKESWVAISTYSNNIGELEKKYNKSQALQLQIAVGTFEKQAHTILSKMEWKKGSQELQLDNRHYWVVVEDLLPAQTKTLDETRGSAISDYQRHLEEEWLKELAQKYAVKIDEATLKQLVK